MNDGFLFIYSSNRMEFDEIKDRIYGAVYFPVSEVDRIGDIVKSIIPLPNTMGMFEPKTL